MKRKVKGAALSESFPRKPFNYQAVQREERENPPPWEYPKETGLSFIIGKGTTY